MSNSALVTCTKLSPNCTKPRNHAIDTITIHCYVGQVTAKRGLEAFQLAAKQASCNYVVGCDGSIGLCVDEANKSWCTSNSANDHRAVTIEVASDNTAPYAITDTAFSALLDLVTDICRRNGIKKLVWSNNKDDRVGHKNGCNLTVHRDYANKACPGEYLYTRHGAIAAVVNYRLNNGVIEEEEDMTYEKWKEYMNRYRAELADQAASMPELLSDAKSMGLTDGTRPHDLVTREEAAVMARAAALK